MESLDSAIIVLRVMLAVQGLQVTRGDALMGVLMTSWEKAISRSRMSKDEAMLLNFALVA